MTKQKITIKVSRRKGELCITNDKGIAWKFPKNIPDDVALSALVYGAILNGDRTLSAYSDEFDIIMEVIPKSE